MFATIAGYMTSLGGSMKVIPHPKPKKKPKKKRGVSPDKLKKIYAEVLERDNYTCQSPHCSDGWPLDPPHHIVKRSQYGLDEHSNLITLCQPCHAKIHHTATLDITGVYPDLEFILK
jgi:5-methylcytosine-specific restriction endonuclease McrA